MPVHVEQTVRQFIIDNFLYRDNGAKLTEDTSFLETGLIDSTGVLELVAFLEETYHFRVSDDEIMPENLDSIGQVTSYIRRKLHGHTNGVAVSHAC